MIQFSRMLIRVRLLISGSLIFTIRYRGWSEAS